MILKTWRVGSLLQGHQTYWSTMAIHPHVDTPEAATLHTGQQRLPVWAWSAIPGSYWSWCIQIPWDGQIEVGSAARMETWPARERRRPGDSLCIFMKTFSKRMFSIIRCACCWSRLRGFITVPRTCWTAILQHSKIHDELRNMGTPWQSCRLCPKRF